MNYIYNNSTGELVGPDGPEGVYTDSAAAKVYLATLGQVFAIFEGEAWSVLPTDHTHLVGQIEPLDLAFLRAEAVAAGVGCNARSTPDGVQFFAGFPLSAGDRATLEAVASAHTGQIQVADPLSLRIGAHLSPPFYELDEPPLDVNYNILAPNLHRRIGTRDSGGYVTRWDFLPYADDGAQGNVVVSEAHTYSIPAPGAAPLYRDVEARWFRRDGEAHPQVKRWRKWYDTPEAIAKEGKLRRGKLMDEAQGNVYGWLLANGYTFADGQEFVSSIADQVKAYTEYSSPEVLTAIGSASFAWLDTTGAFPESWATPVITDPVASPSGTVTPREYLLGVLNIYS